MSRYFIVILFLTASIVASDNPSPIEKPAQKVGQGESDPAPILKKEQNTTKPYPEESPELLQTQKMNEESNVTVIKARLAATIKEVAPVDESIEAIDKKMKILEERLEKIKSTRSIVPTYEASASMKELEKASREQSSTLGEKLLQAIRQAEE